MRFKLRLHWGVRLLQRRPSLNSCRSGVGRWFSSCRAKPLSLLDMAVRLEHGKETGFHRSILLFEWSNGYKTTSVLVEHDMAGTKAHPKLA
ncbi:unnamed protein product [Victoria cruziana]